MAVCSQHSVKFTLVRVGARVRPTSLVASGATLTVPASFHMFLSIVSNTESRVNHSRQISRNAWSQTAFPKHWFSRSWWRLRVSKARERARKEEDLAYPRRSPWLGWATGLPDWALDTKTPADMLAGWDLGDDAPALP